MTKMKKTCYKNIGEERTTFIVVLFFYFIKEGISLMDIMNPHQQLVELVGQETADRYLQIAKAILENEKEEVQC